MQGHGSLPPRCRLAIAAAAQRQRTSDDLRLADRHQRVASEHDRQSIGTPVRGHPTNGPRHRAGELPRPGASAGTLTPRFAAPSTLVGPTGVGKSTLLLNLITQDMAAGRAVVVIEPKSDLIADVLERVPANRVDDVVLLDPTDTKRPVGLNPLALGGRSPELVADQLLGLFHSMLRRELGTTDP